MEQLLDRDPLQQPRDAEGSLIDADMGAYYTWINQSRLPGADQSRFLVWFEDQHLASAIPPTLPKALRLLDLSGSDKCCSKWRKGASALYSQGSSLCERDFQVSCLCPSVA